MALKHIRLLLMYVALAVFAFVACALAANTGTISARTKTDVNGCGCGSSCTTTGKSADSLDLTAAQKQKLASIDKQYNPRSQKMTSESDGLRREFAKLISDANADEVRLARVVRRQSYLQGEIFLWNRQRDKAIDNVYTAKQKSILAKTNGGGCGCGSTSGGCGSSPASSNKGGK